MNEAHDADPRGAGARDETGHTTGTTTTGRTTARPRTAAAGANSTQNTKERKNGLGAVSAKSRTAMIVAGVAIAVVAFLALGFAVNWGLAAIFAIIMVPGAISTAIIARHPEKTGGRSMLGVSNPDTLLEPFTGKRK